jgi:hypothetical protein
MANDLKGDDKDLIANSQKEHSPRTKAIVITVGMIIGLVLLYFAIQFGARPPAPR